MKIDYAEHYNSEYWQGQKTYRDATGRTQVYHGPALHWEGFQIIADALAPLVPGKSILDIGCGGGSLAAEFLKKDYAAYGVDISEHAVENCVEAMKGRIALADISTAPELHAHTTWFAKDDTRWIFPRTFDVVMATDLLEHLYQEDLDRTFDWMVAKSNKWLFFCVATCHDPSHGPGSLNRPSEFIHKKGEPVPLQWEATAVSGHVNVRTYKFWIKYFRERGLTIRWDLMYLLQMQREFSKPFAATLGWQMANTYILQKA